MYGVFYILLTIHYHLSTWIQSLIKCYMHVIRNDNDEDSVARMKAAAEALETKEKVILAT